MLKFLKYFGSTVLALAVLVLILPYFVTLNSYKGEVTTKVRELTGRDLKIEGDIKFSILPRPYLKLKGIQFSSVPQAQEPIMASVKELEVVLSILPLFSGKVEVSKVVLEGPEITLEKLKNGKANWEINFAKIDTDQEGDQQESRQTPQTLGTDASSTDVPQESPVLVKNIKIKDATIRYVEGSKTTELKDINLSLRIERLQGPINFDVELQLLGETVDLQGRLKEIGPQIPVEAKLKLLGKKLILGGVIDVVSQSFNGDLELKGTLKALKKLMPDLNLPDPLKEKYILKANIKATADKVLLEKIDFNLTPLQAQGRAVVDLKKTTGSLTLDLMPGAVHIDLRPDAPRKDQFSGAISIRAKDVLQLLQALKIKTKDLPPFLLKDFSFATHVTYKDQKASLKNINLDVGKAKLDGNLTVQNWEKEGQYDFDLRTRNLSALGKLLDVKVPESIGPAKVMGKASGKPDQLKVDVSLYAANAHTHIKGLLVQKEKALKPDLSVSMTGKSLQSTLRHLGQKEPSKALGGFNLKAYVGGDIPQRAKINVQKSHLMIGRDQVGLKGDVDLFLSAAKPKVSADLSVSMLNLDRLLSAFEQGASIKQAKGKMEP
ncbi:MAG: AsmA family protein [Simkaniaceae bacterium]|nr:AsmA family protein [Simkaniaceae bacterium]